ncbi:MAG: hypothetical protein H6709_08250 [Kofleriaceae bacterium]|nr:hypothetical protein [Kofleriaceae bacterium]MCB9572068.1 hypothetical protein [Kofleriaceae bacterium]
MPRRVPALLLVGLAACGSSTAPTPARDAAAVTVVGDDAADAPAGATAEAALDAGDGLDAGGALDPAERLRAARALSEKLRWKASIDALVQAAPSGDEAVLEELAFTAVVAGDGRRATAAATEVLTHDDLPATRRATAYYHLGRAAELRGDLDAARDAYEQALRLDDRAQFSTRLAKLAPRRAPPPPPAPPCAGPLPATQLCGCLATAMGIEGPPRCVASHRHGGAAWAVTVVSRAATATFLVAQPAKGKVATLARLDADDAELTITDWTVTRGPAGDPLIHVDVELVGHDGAGKARPAIGHAILCVAGAAPRCLLEVPTLERVGTPAAARRTDVDVEVTGDHGVAWVTLIEGPATAPDLLGALPLW